MEGLKEHILLTEGKMVSIKMVGKKLSGAMNLMSMIMKLKNSLIADVEKESIAKRYTNLGIICTRLESAFFNNRGSHNFRGC